MPRDYTVESFLFRLLVMDSPSYSGVSNTRVLLFPMPPKRQMQQQQNKRKGPSPRKGRSSQRRTIPSSALTTYQYNRLAINRSNTGKIRVPRNLSPAKHYFNALAHPFSPDAVGAISPSWRQPNSVPFKIQWSSVIRPKQGMNNYLFIPNPHIYGVAPFIRSGSVPVTNQSQLDPSVIMGPVAVVTTQTSAPTATDKGVPGIMAPVVLNTSATDPPLASQFSSTRTVCGGVRMSSDSSTTANNARIWAAQVPLIRCHVPWNVLTGCVPNTTDFQGVTDGTDTNEAIQLFTGIKPSSLPYTGYATQSNIGASIMSLPGVQTITGNEVILRDAEFHFLPQSPECFSYRDTETVGENRTYNYDRTRYVDWTDVNAVNSLGQFPNGPPVAFSSDCINTDGWNGVLMTIVAPDDNSVFNIDYVIHCEGIPNLTNSGGNGNYYSTGTPQSEETSTPAETIVSLAKKSAPWFNLALKGMNAFYQDRELQDIVRGALRLEL